VRLKVGPLEGQQAGRLGRALRAPWNRAQAFSRLREYHSSPRSARDAVEWALRFGSAGSFRIHTVQKRSEIESLAHAVAELRPRVVLEIGTARGGTALIWSTLASELVLTCDLDHPPERTPLLEAFPPPSSSCRTRLLTGDSHTPEFRQRVVEALAGRPVDFLFIDGDHTEAGVEKDYEDYHELVRPGGLIAFHDIVEKQALPTNVVFPFWERVKQRWPHEEFIDDPNQVGFGIGLLRVPGDS
jgi:predicted O-methyltransferase YrrM